MEVGGAKGPIPSAQGGPHGADGWTLRAGGAESSAAVHALLTLGAKQLLDVAPVTTIKMSPDPAQGSGVRRTWGPWLRALAAPGRQGGREVRRRLPKPPSVRAEDHT